MDNNSNQGESSNQIRRFSDNNAQNTVNINLPDLSEVNELSVSGNNANNTVVINSNRNNNTKN
jgi:hypothetical protein